MLNLENVRSIEAWTLKRIVPIRVYSVPRIPTGGVAKHAEISMALGKISQGSFQCCYSQFSKPLADEAYCMHAMFAWMFGIE